MLLRQGELRLRPSSSSLGKKLEQSLVPGCLCSWASPCWVDNPWERLARSSSNDAVSRKAPKTAWGGSAAPWLLRRGCAHPSTRVSVSYKWLSCSVYAQLWALLRQRLGHAQLSVPKAQSEASKGATDEWWWTMQNRDVVETGAWVQCQALPLTGWVWSGELPQGPGPQFFIYTTGG